MKIEEFYQIFLSCKSICTDTRKIEKDCLFIAIKGENYNANIFAESAIEWGAKYAIVDEKKYKTKNNIFFVENTIVLLQQLANYHRKQLGLPIIAITGSNGKTTSKELINAVLSKKYNTKATIGNLNNHIGVPLTLLSFTKNTEIGIVEMGANHQKEIELLCNIAEPDFGYITNFGKAHLEGFGGIDGVIKGKSELYTYLHTHNKTAFINLDDKLQNDKTKNIARFSFATEDYNCDVKIEKVTASPLVSITYSNTIVNSKLIGIYNAGNINIAITIGLFFKINIQKIKEAIEEYTPNNNRSQLLEKGNNKIILDAYNANPSSMFVALENFMQLKGDNKIIILGDMFELGTESIEEHKKVIEKLTNKNIDTYFIGKDFYYNKIDKKYLNFFPDYNSFLDTFKKLEINNTLILVKGSRGMALERVLELF